MNSLEHIIHGTASAEDALKIEAEGFRVLEGRATVSGDLIYAFKWATDIKMRQWSKSESGVNEGEQGRIVIMNVPYGFVVNYATQTDIAVDEENKQTTGYTSKYQSGRRQLGIYKKDSKASLVAAGKVDKNKVTVPSEEIILRILPAEELGAILHEFDTDVRQLHKIDFERYTQEIAHVVEMEQKNFVAPGTDVRKIIAKLLRTTVEAEVINMIRSLSVDVKKAKGFTVYNRGELKDKPVNIPQLHQELEKMKSVVDAPDFTMGMGNVDRYLRRSIALMLGDLQRQ
ncbi:MAG: hypothetical protein A2542_02925 [Parcubacteria group bacterium RIFOXYD2_FULL_52_8]|nr:MAG: hypothetical protein A2542_02925 [Parcubacteria group bacterium RIFOXYD2_FULL_52_8]